MRSTERIEWNSARHRAGNRPFHAPSAALNVARLGTRDDDPRADIAGSHLAICRA